MFSKSTAPSSSLPGNEKPNEKMTHNNDEMTAAALPIDDNIVFDRKQQQKIFDDTSRYNTATDSSLIDDDIDGEQWDKKPTQQSSPPLPIIEHLLISPLQPTTSNEDNQILDIIHSDIGSTTIQEKLKAAVDKMTARYIKRYSTLAQAFENLEAIRSNLEHELTIQQAHYDKAVREMKFYKSKYQRLRLTQHQNQQYQTPLSRLFIDDDDIVDWQRRVTTANNTSEEDGGDSAYQQLQQQDEQVVDLMAVLAMEDQPETTMSSTKTLPIQTVGVGPSAPPPTDPPPPPPLQSYTVPACPSSPEAVQQDSSPENDSASEPSSDPLKNTRTMPLTFACGDGFWDTIARGKNNKVEVDSLISNYLRRGGQPNVAKNSSTLKSVKEGYGLIHALIAVKNSSALSRVVEAGANPNVIALSPEESDRTTPLVLASQLGYLTGIRLLLERARADIFQRGPNQITALHAAIEKGADDIVMYLLRASKYALLDIVDVEVKQTPTPLDLAKSGGFKTISEYLRKMGAKTTKEMEKTANRSSITNGGTKEYSSTTSATTSRSSAATTSTTSSTQISGIAALGLSSTISRGSTATATTSSSRRSVISSSSGSASILSGNESAISRDSASFVLSRSSISSFRNNLLGH
ncbi:hypothetical protein BDB00DRAFT_788148 [Zychaea mexicana]|uniref:uncharacterized protein n=1 Tax=Zychaea mexicana TaxID=64656 RepID=UPI0022FE16AA|nr:uncharacterized protein BDB00DRAFT_788148 [Zychaea mexicana]KAI9493088.1 hypothetical protein BDB00DRAFT_788148 [Zychaea mexicana]